MNALVIGGNRFFGKKLVNALLKEGLEVTLLNRGHLDDGFGNKVFRLKCDRSDQDMLERTLGEQSWDLVYDQICFDYQSAKEACEVFKDRCQHFVMASSQSVYGYGKEIKEENFIAENYQMKKEIDSVSDYAEAKRQAEFALTKYASFPVSRVRFPIVLGADDYTERFKFHVDRIKSSQPIFFPKPKAKMSFVKDEFAAQALVHLGMNKLDGAYNVSNPALHLDELMQMIGEFFGKSFLPANKGNEKNHSPYGIGQDWFMSTKKLNDSGMIGDPLSKWIEELLAAFK